MDCTKILFKHDFAEDVLQSDNLIEYFLVLWVARLRLTLLTNIIELVWMLADEVTCQPVKWFGHQLSLSDVRYPQWCATADNHMKPQTSS